MTANCIKPPYWLISWDTWRRWRTFCVTGNTNLG